MKKLLITLFSISCIFSKQVLADEEAPSTAAVEPRQSIIGSPFANPFLGGVQPSITPWNFAAQNSPFIPQQLNSNIAGISNLGGLQVPVGNLQSLSELQILAGLQNLAELQGLSELQSISGMQGLPDIQNVNGQVLQDPQNNFLKRIGPLGTANGLLQRQLGLGSPLISGLGGVNPGIRRNLGGQNTLRDILALDTLFATGETSGRSSNSVNFQHQQNLQQQNQQQQLQLQNPSGSRFTSLFAQNNNDNRLNKQNQEDQEIATLLQMLTTLQNLPSNNRGIALATAASLPPRFGLRALGTSPFLGRGGNFLSGPRNVGFQKRTAPAESDKSDLTIARVGTQGNSNPSELQMLLRRLSDDQDKAYHRQEDVYTEDDFKFPNSG